MLEGVHKTCSIRNFLRIQLGLLQEFSEFSLNLRLINIVYRYKWSFCKKYFPAQLSLCYLFWSTQQIDWDTVIKVK